MSQTLRALGKTGLHIGPLVLGGNVFGWTCPRRESFAVLDAYAALGGGMIDTADVYSRWAPGHHGGESETIIGDWIRQRGHHHDVLIATKVGSDMGLGHICLRREHILRSVEDSLRRLGVDCIDLYQSHWFDKRTPPQETLGAFQQLLEQGKVRAIGCSNHSPAQLMESIEVAEVYNLPAYQVLQPQYNLMARAGFEGELRAICQREGLGVIAYHGLASGFLSGKYRRPEDVGQSARGEAVRQHLAHPMAPAVLAALDDIAARHGASPAQVALAWIMAQPGVTAPIASATSTAQLAELAGAAQLQLDGEDLAALDAASTLPSD